MITCENLTKQYKRRSIIQDASVTFESNTISFIMGANGSGKTTFVKCMMELERHQGSFLFDGQDIDAVRHQCLVLWDDCPFYPNLSGIHNLALFSDQQPDVRQIALQYLNEDILKSKVWSYSYGQKKILGIILVELLQPTYLIMDEISNGLDYDTIRRLQQNIVQWSEHMTILLTGHQFGFYNTIVNDIFVLKDQKLTLKKRNHSCHDELLEDIYAQEIH